MAILESVFGNPEESPNALMRFGAALQGPQAQLAMQEMQRRKKEESVLASLAPRIQAGDKSALLELATINPQAASALAQFAPQGPEFKVQEINGQLVRFNPNDPNSKPEVIFGQGGGLNPKTVEGEGALRKEFDGLQKDFRTVQDGYTRLEAAAKDPSAAGDLALIFSYMKILDPGSTVREGEFANAQNATSVPGAVLNAYNRALTGERLSPDMRTDFVGKAKSLYQAQSKTFNKSAKKYRTLAKEYGYDPERITEEVVIEETPAPPPSAGMTREQKLQRLQELKALKARRGGG